MNRKRGAPVLIELISRPSGPSVGGSPVAPYPTESEGRAGHPMSNPANWGSASSRAGSGGGWGGGSAWRLPALLIGAGLVVVVLALIMGYQLGQKKEKQNWAENNAAGNPSSAQPGAPVPPPGGSGLIDPLNGGGVTDPNAPAGGGVLKPGPIAGAPHTPVADAGLQDGWNYLVVASLRRSEAEEAARYLADNGIPVQLQAAERGGVDRTAGGANNGLWQLWVLRGVPSGEYTQRRAEREALENKVKLLGRTWKAQNRKAPTDFGSTYWVRFKA